LTAKVCTKLLTRIGGAKLGHCDFQIRTEASELGHYPAWISSANGERKRIAITVIGDAMREVVEREFPQHGGSKKCAGSAYGVCPWAKNSGALTRGIRGNCAVDGISRPTWEPRRCHTGVTPRTVIGPVSAFHNALSAHAGLLVAGRLLRYPGAANRLTLMVF
jgi:hypothetical protein